MRDEEQRARDKEQFVAILDKLEKRSQRRFVNLTPEEEFMSSVFALPDDYERPDRDE